MLFWGAKQPLQITLPVLVALNMKSALILWQLLSSSMSVFWTIFKALPLPLGSCVWYIQWDRVRVKMNDFGRTQRKSWGVHSLSLTLSLQLIPTIVPSNLRRRTWVNYSHKINLCPTSSHRWWQFSLKGCLTHKLHWLLTYQKYHVCGLHVTLLHVVQSVH